MAVSYDKNNQTSGLNSAERLNAELTKIQTALLDAVSRSGNAPNAMSADLDLGGNDLLNVDTVYCSELLVDGAPLPSLENIIEAFEDGQAALDDSIAQAQQDLNDAVAEATSDLNDAVSQAESDLNSAVSAAESTIQGYVSTAQSAASDAQAAQSAASYFANQATEAANDAALAQAAAEAAQAAAEDARDEAADLIASVDLPEITAADAGKVLSVSPAGQYEVALVLKDEIEKAVARLTRWSPFTELGSPFDLPYSLGDALSVAALTMSRVVVCGMSDGELRTLEFDGSTWTEVASGTVVPTDASSGSITGASHNRAVLVRRTPTGAYIQMFQESSGTWSAEGNAATVTSDNAYVSVATLNSTTAVTVASDGFLRAHEFDGTDWTTVGSQAVANAGTVPKVISFPDDNRVIVGLSGSGQFACYEWDGSAFHHVSTSTNFGWTTGSAAGGIGLMCPLSRMDFVVSRHLGARIVRFDGHDWYPVDGYNVNWAVTLPIGGARALFSMSDNVIGIVESDISSPPSHLRALSTQLTLGRANTLMRP